MKRIYLLLTFLISCSSLDIENPIAGFKLKSLTLPTYYLNQEPIAISTRYSAHAEDISHAACKVYSGSYCEISNAYLLFIVADNNSGPNNNFKFDQTFLKYKLKSDGLPFEQGWTWYADITGEPIPILSSLFGIGTAWDRGQIWMGTPTVFADNNIQAYYSANTTISSRYSLGRVVMDFTGFPTTSPTITKDTNAIFTQTSGKNYWQFHQGFYDTDLKKWIIMGVNPGNSGNGTQGRFGQMNVYTSTDSIIGKHFTQTGTNIFDSTLIEEGGFGFVSQMWKQDGKYYFYANQGELPSYIGNVASNTLVYAFLQKKIILVSCPDITVIHPVLTIESTIYETDQQSEASIFPCSIPIVHNGHNYIITNCFTWRVETFPQLSTNIKVLTDYTGSGNLVGSNLYPSYISQLFKLHQTHLDETINSTTVLPIEAINNTSMSVIGSPTQWNLNRSKPTSTGYVQASNFTYDTQHLSLLINIDGLTHTGKFGIVSMDSAFSLREESGKLIVRINGNGGLYKEYKTVSTMNTFKTGVFKDNFMKAGFTVNLNAGGTDLDLKINSDFTLDCPVTITHNDTFTSLHQSHQPLKFGVVNLTGISNYTWEMGTCIMFAGSGATQNNWLNCDLN